MALAAALAAACFVRAYGIAFLGRPRSEAARTAHEIARPAQAAMGIAALLCCVLGMFPGPVIDLIGGAVGDDVGAAATRARRVQGWLSLVPVSPAASSYNGLVLLVFIAFSSITAAFFVHRFASDRTAARAGLGLRLPGPVERHAVHGLELRPAAAAGLRRLRLPRPRAGRHAGAGRDAGGAVPACAGATSSGTASTHRWPRAWAA